MTDIAINLRHEDVVQIAVLAIREAIKTDAWMRECGLITINDMSNIMLQEALEYFAGAGETTPCQRFDRGFEAGALAGDAREVGLIGYQLGRREERQRCAWIAEQMADGRGTDWDLACLAICDVVRGQDEDRS